MKRRKKRDDDDALSREDEEEKKRKSTGARIVAAEKEKKEKKKKKKKKLRVARRRTQKKAAKNEREFPPFALFYLGKFVSKKKRCLFPISRHAIEPPTHVVPKTSAAATKPVLGELRGHYCRDGRRRKCRLIDAFTAFVHFPKIHPRATPSRPRLARLWKTLDRLERFRIVFERLLDEQIRVRTEQRRDDVVVRAE